MFLPPLFACSGFLSIAILIIKINFIWDFKVFKDQNGREKKAEFFWYKYQIFAKYLYGEQMWLFSYLVNHPITLVKWLIIQSILCQGQHIPFFLIIQFSELTEMMSFVPKMVTMFVHLSVFLIEVFPNSCIWDKLWLLLLCDGNFRNTSTVGWTDAFIRKSQIGLS